MVLKIVNLLLAMFLIWWPVGGKPDTIILDPPREGINPKAIEKIIKFDAETLVYVSCKASSLAKDLLLFEEGGYKVRKICSVDMFPRTYHVETVVLLSKVTDWFY